MSPDVVGNAGESHDHGRLRANRWRRYGKDRLYIVDGAGANVGWVDLVGGASTIEAPEQAAAFDLAVTEWLSSHPEAVRPGGAVPCAEPAETVRQEAARPEALASAPPRVCATEERTPVLPVKSLDSDSGSERVIELPKRMRARYDGTCAACGEPTARGSVIYWSKAARVAVCGECMAFEGLEPRANVAGGGAQLIADRAAAKHASAVRAAFPELASIIVELNRSPSHVHSWEVGADGERVVARELERLAAKRGNVLVLHDRLIPETGGNIDHIAIGPKRIGVLDAKNYQGRRVRVPRAGQDGEGRRLFIDGRDCTKLADAVRLQAARVSQTIESVVGAPVAAVPYLVFVNASFGFMGSPQYRTRKVWSMGPKEAAEHVSYRGPTIGDSFTFDESARQEILSALSERFPPNQSF